MRSSHLRHLILSATILALVGCQALRPGPLATPQGMSTATRVAGTIEGRFDPGAPRAAQATTADLVASATISFIDTATNATVATGKTNASGAFSLTLAGYAPAPGGTYLLEAIKGLNGQAPGAAAARFRTVLQWNGTAWLSCTNALPGGSIVINALTTALAVEAALDPLNVPAINTIGKVNNTTTPATLYATPGPYTGHPDTEITQLASDLTATLGMDADPMASVPSITPTVTSFTPGSAGEGSLVRILGTGFSPIPSGNTVTFNGTAATVLVASPTSLVVIVPAGVTGGTLRVQTGRGAANSAATFSPSGSSGGSGGGSGGGSATSIGITSYSPTSGRVGDTLTLTGAFGNATPSIVFSGASGSVQAQVTAWGPTAMTVTVPLGAVSGPISVGSGFETAQALVAFNLLPGDLGSISDDTAFSGSANFQAYTGVASGSYYYFLTSIGVGMVTLESDGTLGNYRRVSPTNYYSASNYSVAIVGNYLYVINYTTVTYARINPDGSLSPFQAWNSAPTRGLYARSAFGRGDRLFVLHNGYPTFEVFTIDPATGLSLNRTMGTLAVTGRTVGNLNYSYLISQALPNHLILVGGSVVGDYQSILSFPLNTTIATGSFQGYLPSSISSNFGSCLSGNRLYMHFFDGGSTYMCSSAVDSTTGTVSNATIEGCSNTLNGTLNYAPIAWGNRIYYFNSALKVIYRLPNDDLVDAGSYGGLGDTRHGATGVMIGNRAWVIGGGNSGPGPGVNSAVSAPLTSTEAFDIREDGIHSASLRGPDLTTARWGASTFTANGYLYVLGGSNTNPNTGALATVERAVINPDGSLGQFAPWSGQMVQPRCNAAVLQAGSYAFVFGGRNAADFLSSVERVKINPDGTLGLFELLSQSPLPTPLGEMGIARVGNRIHLIGGNTGGTNNTAAVYTTTLDEARGLLGPFSSSPNLVAAKSRPGIVRFGNYLYCFGGSTSNTIQRSALGPNGDLSPWATVGTLPAGWDFTTGPYAHPRGILLFPQNSTTGTKTALWAPSLY